MKYFEYTRLNCRLFNNDVQLHTLCITERQDRASGYIKAHLLDNSFNYQVISTFHETIIQTTGSQHVQQASHSDWLKVLEVL